MHVTVTSRVCGSIEQVHLFDIDIPGKIQFKESETLSPGKAGTVVDTPHGVVGIGICYDLRFPELAQIYAKKGANIIIYPGAHPGGSTSLGTHARCHLHAATRSTGPVMLAAILYGPLQCLLATACCRRLQHHHRAAALGAAAAGAGDGQSAVCCRMLAGTQ